jgi:predicted RND superfamily exporter protein
MKRLEEFISSLVIKRRWWILLISLFIVIASSSGLRHLSFNSDLRVFFSRENPQFQALEALEKKFNKSDNVLLALAPRDGTVFTRRTLQAIAELTEASWQVPYSNRVDSITNFQHTRAEEDDLIVEDLVNRPENLSEKEIRKIRVTALNEPALINRLISPSGHVTAININIIKPGKSIQEVPEIAAYVYKLADDFREKHPDIDLYVNGMVMYDNAYTVVSIDDAKYLIPAMLILLLLIVGILLQSVTGTFTTLAIIVFSMITAMGLAGWFGIQLNIGSAIAPTIILTLAVADSIHILATMFQLMRKGTPHLEAVAESLRINLQPVFLTSVTTATGFLSMNFSDAPPFRDLGNIVAIGVMAALMYSVFFMPALLSVLPLRAKAKAGRADLSCSSCNSVADFIINRRKPMFWGILLLIVIMTAGIFQIELNDDFVSYLDKRYDIRTSTDFLKENLSGVYTIEYSLNSGEPGGVNNPEYLTKVEEFTDWYSRQPEVVHVRTITDTMKRLNKNMHGDDQTYYRIPESRELAAQYLLLYEMSLPYGLDLNNQIDMDKSATKVTVTTANPTAVEMRRLDEKARVWLKVHAQENMYTYGSGLSIVYAHISHRNINSMLGASIGALILISGILIFALRNLRLGIISLIPNLTPAFMAFGIWGILVNEVGLAISIAVSLTLGIVVDDTVHFMSKYLRARREHGKTPEDAVRYSFNTVGPAIIISTIALAAGFMVLSLSGFKVNSDMGIMSALTIVIALALDFLFLPVILMMTDKKTFAW